MIDKVYFDGTSVTSVSLVEGAPITVLHLPSTITSLVLMDHTKLADLSCPSYANVTTLMMRNIAQSVLDPLVMLDTIPAGSRVNIQGLYIDIVPQSGDQVISVPTYDQYGNQTGTESVTLTTNAEKAGYQIEQFLD